MYDNIISVDILLSVEQQWKLCNNIIENVSSMYILGVAFNNNLKIALLLKTTTGCWAIFALLQAEHQNNENKLTQNNTHTQTSNNIHRTSINVHI